MSAEPVEMSETSTILPASSSSQRSAISGSSGPKYTSEKL